jgi:Fic family protein
MRTYEQTHPWLSFSANLQNAPPRLWLMLGECQSKCEHIAKVPLRPATADQLYQVYLAKGVLATNAIEGNTLSEQEVRQHLEGKLELPASREYLAREIDNIVNGCNETLRIIVEGKRPPVTPDAIKHLNETVLNGLTLEEGCVPGQTRPHSVVVGRYRGAPAQDCEWLLQRLCEWLNGKDFDAPSGLDIVYAILRAVIAHLYLAWIHPFADGNGRTARLLEFRILLGAGVPAASAHLLSNHYNLTRSEYYRQLEHASKSGGDVLPFISYAIQGFLDGLKQQIDMIWMQQWDIAWRNYVHEQFRDKSSSSHVRQRHLVLDLSLQSVPVPKGGIPEISARLARAYANRTDKTLTRDLNAMCGAGLIVATPDGYRAHKELILAFLPQRAGGYS